MITMNIRMMNERADLYNIHTHEETIPWILLCRVHKLQRVSFEPSINNEFEVNFFAFPFDHWFLTCNLICVKYCTIVLYTRYGVAFSCFLNNWFEGTDEDVEVTF